MQETMVGARSILLLLLLAIAAASLAPLASADCHSSWYGCRECPEDGECDGDLIGTIAGILVSGDTDEGEGEDGGSLAASVVQAQPKGGRAGHVDLRFEWADQAGPSVPLRLWFSGNVEWPGARDNVTVAFMFDGDQNVSVDYTIRGSGHRHIPFRIVAHDGTPDEEVLEGVFTIEEPKRGNSFTPWPAAAGILVLGLVAWRRR